MNEQKREVKNGSTLCQGRTALVVDDNEGIRRSVCAQLKQHGIAATVAANGRLATVALSRGSFDLIVTDLDMPEMNGLDLLLWLRERNPLLPVVVMSGTLPTDIGEVAFLRNTAMAVLLKPFTSEEFAAALRPVCERLAAARLRDYAA